MSLSPESSIPDRSSPDSPIPGLSGQESSGPDRRLLVVGSGSLARAVCNSLALVARAPTAVTVVARNDRKVRDLCLVAAGRAAIAGRPVAFTPVRVEAVDADALSRTCTAARPSVVLCCASLQSPWEPMRAPSAWTKLQAMAGFGLSLPLHARIAGLVAEVTAATVPGTPFVNACYPDAVNPLLHARGETVLCGVGNVAMLVAAARAYLGAAPEDRLRMIAHHAHLHAPAEGEAEARLWNGQQPVPDVAKVLAPVRRADRPGLNDLTGHDAALFLDALLGGGPYACHAAGPLGLPGGYPVRLQGGRLDLDLPDGVPAAAAIALNQAAARAEGVVVEHGGEVRFSRAAADAIEPWLPQWADGFAAKHAEQVTADLLALREELRKRPV